VLVGFEMRCVSHKRGGNETFCAWVLRCAFRKLLEGAFRSFGSVGIGNKELFGLDGNNFGDG
jgi:hypothetical protein